MALWLPDTTRSVRFGGLKDFVQLLRTLQSRLIDQSSPTFGTEALPTSLKSSCRPPSESSSRRANGRAFSSPMIGTRASTNSDLMFRLNSPELISSRMRKDCWKY